MPEKHFTMIRSFHLADVLTLANGCCGLAALFHSIRFVEGGDVRQLWLAAGLVPLAAVFDVLDGRVARWRHTNSALGRELDSLADVISFGVAPAAIAYAAGLRTVLDQIMLMYFALCGLSRLARYNITAESLAGASGAVTHFEGTPIPTSIVPLALLMIAFQYFDLGPRAPGFHWVSLLFVASGSLMISKTLRIPKP
jgi:CDP-diacylglycerol--serine O-phosphatidyltransferase